MPHFERPRIRRVVAFALTMLQTSFRLDVRVLSFQWRNRTAPRARWPWLLQWFGFKLKVVGSAATSPKRNAAASSAGWSLHREVVVVGQVDANELVAPDAVVADVVE